MKTILVTGGAGFIGSHLCERLLKEGNKVLVIDNFNDYYDSNIKRNNIKEIIETCEVNNIDKENFKVFEGDIRDNKFLEKVFLNNIDCIMHLAAMAGVRPSIQNPNLYYDVNITGTLNLLEKCRENNIKNFVFASSSSVYGNNEKVPFAESDFVDYPISPYAATKKSGELLCHTYHHLYDMDIACLRFFTVYGPRQRPDLAIHKFAKLIMEEKEIPFYGDGSTSRDYTYISDIINGIVSAIDYIDKNENIFDVFNLGGDKTVSLIEMVKTIENTLNKKAKLNKMPMQPGDVNRTCADITHSKNILDYSPETSFKEGTKEFIKWLKK
ncbi:SDR family NAD(P)-dependent oxidoreductase [Clostridium perfringens]|uniref:SDR family NAD(P)-dependent oxidoreductase n=1 Tax=Clostridium perfringens TaxID=1502 RepID=UPI0021489880|nr:SDR family NAD(P)-dependent oxidoreductase [Clostridium perfringens]MDM0818953.1 SDR family NAD(P)-dependent oxidoreductase [Clostridium perfringens]UUR81528.1 SDR family NAD(P)-dependent oxidoreductase [Clostridium perfringens]